ncbi:MAG: sigma-70 family RNA polymerase sigma factor, partial [Thermoanaerobaculales bacterium]|nr:sigma-70 family RNA polymerase sigma factor [Thermoanaerobaculales bacterium]
VGGSYDALEAEAGYVGSSLAVTFEELYHRFRRPVWSLARRMTRTDDEALDASQEIFLRVWRGLDGFRHEAKLSTWVYQIAWNYLRSYRRRLGRQPVATHSLSEEGAVRTGAIHDRAPDPERRAIASEGLERVEEALERLAEHHRVVLWLRDGEDLSYEEIATILDVPIGTVRSRLARARRALRDEVRP